MRGCYGCSILLSPFTGHLSYCAANHADEYFKLEGIDALIAYVRVNFSNEDLEGMHLYALTELDKLNKSLHEYTHEFNKSYSYWKDDISVKAATYLCIEGLKVGALRTNFMISWHAGKSASMTP